MHFSGIYFHGSGVSGWGEGSLVLWVEVRRRCVSARFCFGLRFPRILAKRVTEDFGSKGSRGLWLDWGLARVSVAGSFFNAIPEVHTGVTADKVTGFRDLSTRDRGRGTTRAKDTQGTPTQSLIPPSILVYEQNSLRSPLCGFGV